MYKRYDSAALTKFIRKATTEKGDKFQIEILEAILDSENFVEWLDNKVNFGEGDEDVMFPPGFVPLAVGEYVEFPIETVLMYYSAWEEFSLADASSPSFWAYVTRQSIIKGIVAPHNLALSVKDKNPLADNAGKEKIQHAFSLSDDDKRCEWIDRRVRNFIRNLCGIVEVRGTRSIYQDCPFARAWWQCHVARSVSSDDWKENILPVLWEKGLWGEMSEKMASQLTVIGDVNIRSGIINHLRVQTQSRRAGPQVEKLLSQVGVMCAWRALGYFPPDKVKEVVDEIAELAFSEDSNGSPKPA